ncbi:hypothetical protein [uncultured Clostridium sp.]|uniref:hypothetical protein n=1 Tax=uncultured Clostridium sp. TaxID=59620 RepID=UPI00259345F8|nr:hypothetical protein [uncultured Clostridium sp.]
MEVNINSKREPYEVGDLIELSKFGFRMIVKKHDNCYFLVSMEGNTTTADYNSIEELLENRNIISHYKNNELVISLRKKQKLF